METAWREWIWRTGDSCSHLISGVYLSCYRLVSVLHLWKSDCSISIFHPPTFGLVGTTFVTAFMDLFGGYQEGLTRGEQQGFLPWDSICGSLATERRNVSYPVSTSSSCHCSRCNCLKFCGFILIHIWLRPWWPWTDFRKFGCSRRLKSPASQKIQSPGRHFYFGCWPQHL